MRTAPSLLHFPVKSYQPKLAGLLGAGAKSAVLLVAVLLVAGVLAPAVHGADDPAFDYLKSRQQRSIHIEGRELPVLVRPWEGRLHHGSSIIFADTGFGPDAPGLVAYLRDGMSPVGWASISMTPPQNPPHPSFATAPEQITKAGEKQLATPPGEAMASYSKAEWQQHLDKQLSFVEQSLGQLDQLGAAYPGNRILVAMERSAGLIIQLLATGSIPAPDLLVVINPYSPATELDARLPGLIAMLDVPVLDIQTPDAHLSSLAGAPLRRMSNSAKGALAYRQQLLALNISEPDSWTETLVAIRGFATSLKSLANNKRHNSAAMPPSGQALQGGNQQGNMMETETGELNANESNDLKERASFMPPGMTPPPLPSLDVPAGEQPTPNTAVTASGVNQEAAPLPGPNLQAPLSNTASNTASMTDTASETNTQSDTLPATPAPKSAGK